MVVTWTSSRDRERCILVMYFKDRADRSCNGLDMGNEKRRIRNDSEVLGVRHWVGRSAMS